MQYIPKEEDMNGYDQAFDAAVAGNEIVDAAVAAHVGLWRDWAADTERALEGDALDEFRLLNHDDKLELFMFSAEKLTVEDVYGE